MRVGNRFRGFLIIAGLGVIIFTLGISILSLIMFFVNGTNLYTMFYFSGFGVVLSIFMCILASMYVLSSLSLADNLIQSGVEKTMEWYASYAITLNVIYLFIEILRLIILLIGRRNNN
ncbi:MAG: Bax inhibitor-1/YccA family membrane protein [Bacilli bacterium]